MKTYCKNCEELIDWEEIRKLFFRMHGCWVEKDKRKYFKVSQRTTPIDIFNFFKREIEKSLTNKQPQS